MAPHWYTSEGSTVITKQVQTANSDPGSLSMIFSDTSNLAKIYALVAGSRITLDRNVNGRMTIAVDLTGLSSSDITNFQAAVSANTDVAANTVARHTHANKTTLDKFSEPWGVLNFNGVPVNFENPFLGQWQDGAVTISVDTTLTRDMYYDTLVVNAWVRLNAAWYRIFAKTSVTVNGIISNNWFNASWSTGWLWASAGTLKWWLDGKNGSIWATGAIPAVAGTAWLTGTASANSLWVAGTAWGAGWDTGNYGPNSIASGGASWAGWARTVAINLPKSIYQFMAFVDANYSVNNVTAYYSSSAWGGWGGWGAAYWSPATGWTGGWGGWWWGIVFIYTPSLTIWATWVIEANWWAGWNGTAWTGGTGWQTAGWGGWGSGWAGWVVILIYKAISNAWVVRALWWAAWAGWSPLQFGGTWATAWAGWVSWNTWNTYTYTYI